MGLLLLSACAKPTEELARIDPVCSVLAAPLEGHMNSIIDFGTDLIKIGADEILVTATEVSDVYQTACNNTK